MKRQKTVYIAVTRRGRLLFIGANKDIAQVEGFYYDKYRGVIKGTVTYDTDDFEEDWQVSPDERTK